MLMSKDDIFKRICEGWYWHNQLHGPLVQEDGWHPPFQFVLPQSLCHDTKSMFPGINATQNRHFTWCVQLTGGNVWPVQLSIVHGWQRKHWGVLGSQHSQTYILYVNRYLCHQPNAMTWWTVLYILCQSIVCNHWTVNHVDSERVSVVKPWPW